MIALQRIGVFLAPLSFVQGAIYREELWDWEDDDCKVRSDGAHTVYYRVTGLCRATQSDSDVASKGAYHIETCDAEMNTNPTKYYKDAACTTETGKEDTTELGCVDSYRKFKSCVDRTSIMQELFTDDECQVREGRDKIAYLPVDFEKCTSSHTVSDLSYHPVFWFMWSVDAGELIYKDYSSEDCAGEPHNTFRFECGSCIDAAAVPTLWDGSYFKPKKMKISAEDFHCPQTTTSSTTSSTASESDASISDVSGSVMCTHLLRAPVRSMSILSLLLAMQG
eukprot:gnl/TRDRNA2_/TRDRNA2_126806_c0_seq1.p1 gnl/TRDRNA2_/TRDRNA2_126806_c0~~gnl/TRDRNA2_/TRDRNA2_126806_c0_seq1.p1  ORF type:complete len:280 (-),score=29.93 gnl/TRDRNA2_/TRDRNA2_126806_c0_seq1:91-930(-)